MNREEAQAEWESGVTLEEYKARIREKVGDVNELFKNSLIKTASGDDINVGAFRTGLLGWTRNDLLEHIENGTLTDEQADYIGIIK